ncbi:FHA domain-containing protein [Microbacterium luticocti]|uniref:FHA domain-containing protein n=1 Tax=Microbacterium luticocti TaxID=451764 RepID=UPI0004260CE3|nr:FHA domain-containing protein [Microbacterium luticocti]
MVALHYAPGDAHLIATRSAVVLIDADVPADLLARIWREVDGGRGLAAVLEALTGAFGTSLTAIPPFLVAVAEPGGVRLAVRGDISATATGGGAPVTVTGAGVTTWSEQVAAGATRTEIGAGATADAVLPLRDGVARAGAVVVDWGVHAASGAPASGPDAEPGRPPVPPAPPVTAASALPLIPPPPPLPAASAAPAALAEPAPDAEPAALAEPGPDEEPPVLQPPAEPAVPEPAAVPGPDEVPPVPEAPAPSVPEPPAVPEPVAPEPSAAPEPLVVPQPSASEPAAVPGPDETPPVPEAPVPEAPAPEPAEPGPAAETPVPEPSAPEPAVPEPAAETPVPEASTPEPAPPAPAAPEPPTETPPAGIETLAPSHVTMVPGLIDDVPRPIVDAPPAGGDVGDTVASVRVRGDHDGETISVSRARELRGETGGDEAPEPLAPPRPAAPGRLRLSTGQVVPLDRTVVIGRRPRSTRVTGTDLPHLIAVASPQQDISRSHLEVRVEDDSILATDLHTTNGTTLRRAGADPVRLHPGERNVVVPGDVLDLGDGITVTVEDIA